MSRPRAADCVPFSAFITVSLLEMIDELVLVNVKYKAIVWDFTIIWCDRWVFFLVTDVDPCDRRRCDYQHYNLFYQSS